MRTIHSSELPERALLKRYERNGSFTDCYRMDLPFAVPMDQYVSAFYTSPLFKVERFVLALAAGKHSTDANARELAVGQTSNFAAWSVEDRSNDQLLLCDFLGRTRSWLMTEPVDAATTRLYFGSAVVPKSLSTTGKASFGFAFHALSGFHHLYTKALMRSAQSQLLKATQ